VYYAIDSPMLPSDRIVGLHGGGTCIVTGGRATSRSGLRRRGWSPRPCPSIRPGPSYRPRSASDVATPKNDRRFPRCRSKRMHGVWCRINAASAAQCGRDSLTCLAWPGRRSVHIVERYKTAVRLQHSIPMDFTSCCDRHRLHAYL